MITLDKFKISSLTWDGDKDPTTFFIFLENSGSLVRATDHGDFLKDMLNSKLNLVKVSTQSVPSFLLEDPDFAATSESVDYRMHIISTEVIIIYALSEFQRCEIGFKLSTSKPQIDT